MPQIELNTPNTYSEWVDTINLLKIGEKDEAVFEAMQRGSIEWQSGIAERFAKKLLATVTHRMNAATDKFQRDLSHSRGQDAIIIKALLALRNEMSFLTKVVDLPAIPEEERPEYTKLVRDQADKLQESLEESAAKDKSGKLSSIIRNHRVNAF